MKIKIESEFEGTAEEKDRLITLMDETLSRYLPAGKDYIETSRLLRRINRCLKISLKS